MAIGWGGVSCRNGCKLAMARLRTVVLGSRWLLAAVECVLFGVVSFVSSIADLCVCLPILVSVARIFGMTVVLCFSESRLGFVFFSVFFFVCQSNVIGFSYRIELHKVPPDRIGQVIQSNPKPNFFRLDWVIYPPLIILCNIVWDTICFCDLDNRYRLSIQLNFFCWKKFENF